ncbi:MFS general substrate transporter [Auriscalpium vulgare]|uniref:MFS general substrate transporter n=1 Tax=Auriscalpium vulgare TaxID=40419 RepID=A0ACB8S1I9_9AGAM|nr:MFS general substrate transporter [Auriscalpium vulgare]
MTASIEKDEGRESIQEKAGDRIEEPVSTVPSVEAARIWRKLDMQLLPFVSLLYLLSFLDRSNIGNARIAGMSVDLNLIHLRYNTAAAVFFIPYCFAEVPSNILLKLFRPSIWIPAIMVAWGIVMTLMCRVNSFEGLIVARVFLGLAEAGLFPGVTYYISLWYPRHMQAKRVAIFFSAATVAGAFGGILAYGIEHLEGKGGLHGWQWIFLIEGLVTVVIAVLAFFFMHDYPETATFLTEREREYVVNALRHSSGHQSTHFEWRFVWQALADWKSWMQVVTYMGVLIPVYAVALFTPSIIKALGYTSARAQLLSIPPFVSGCLFTIIVGIASDKMQRRGVFVILGAAVGMIGYIVAYTTSAPGPGYAAAVIAATGVYPTVAVILAWSGGNAGGDMKRGVVIAMVIGIGNLGGICSSYIYFDGPRYHQGHGTIIGWLGLTIILTSILMWKYDRLNKEKEELCVREGITEDMKHQYADMGDKSPLFRYVI